MNKSQALNQFWNSFGIPAFDEDSVPDNTPFPYITYAESLDSLGNILILTASVWDRGTSWKRIADKTEEIARKLGEYGHYTIKLDNGYLYLSKGSPFATRQSDQDPEIRRYYINVMGEFLTAY